MAKPIMQFNAVAYDLGEDKKGLRPQLVAKDAVVDIDLCREVVNERRLVTSPEELLHGFSSLADVAMAKVAEDGRPRAITRLIKFAPYATGKLESPSSPWNDSCKAIVRAVLLSDAKKTLDASFHNTTEGIGVRLNDVTYIGAKTVQNVIKVGVHFAAYGSHMEFIEGDTAILKVGAIEHPLTCVASDVSSAEFEFPEALEDVEPGTQALFLMKSRGGVEDGQVYTVKKLVTILAADIPTVPTIRKATSETTGNVNEWKPFRDTTIVEGYNLSGATPVIELVSRASGAVLATVAYEDGNVLTHDGDNRLTMKIIANTTPQPDGVWESATNFVRLRLNDQTLELTRV